METSKQNIFYVYIHIFKNNTIYVGKGKVKRAYKIYSRNKHWHHLFNRHGKPKIRIIKNNLTEKEAFDLEKSIILKYKKKERTLCNITNGGDGISGYKHTVKSRLQMSKNSAMRNPEYSKMMGMKRKGKPSARKGIIASDETKRKISKNRKGKCTGKDHPNYGLKGKECSNYGKGINKEIFTFIHPIHGEVESTIHNLYTTYNLCDSGVHRLTQHLKSRHKRWTLKGNTYVKPKKAKVSKITKDRMSKAKKGKISPKRDNSLYQFINLELGIILECTKFELCYHYSLCIFNVTSIVDINKDRYIHKGWMELSQIDKQQRKCLICSKTIYENKYCSIECKKRARADFQLKKMYKQKRDKKHNI